MLATGLCTGLSTATSRKEPTRFEERYWYATSVRHGTLLYLTPDVAPYHPDMKKVEKELDQHMSTLDIDMTKVPELPTGVDAVEQLKLLINTLKSTQYHTDLWQLDEVNHTLTRVHTCPRRTFFTPESSDCPVPLDRLNGQLTTHLDYGKGDVKEVLDNFRNTGLPNQVIDGDWKGRTVFQLKTVPTHLNITPRQLLTVMLCLRKSLDTQRYNHPLSGTLCGTHKGHLISTLIMKE